MPRWRAGRIDVLVNSAGHGPKGPLLDISDADWQRGMDTYLLNVVRPTRLVVPAMQRQGGGAIVNISSAWAFEPSELFSDLGGVSRGPRGLHQSCLPTATRPRASA